MSYRFRRSWYELLDRSMARSQSLVMQPNKLVTWARIDPQGHVVRSATYFLGKRVRRNSFFLGALIGEDFERRHGMIRTELLRISASGRLTRRLRAGVWYGQLAVQGERLRAQKRAQRELTRSLR